jgi:hypothetical protein
MFVAMAFAFLVRRCVFFHRFGHLPKCPTELFLSLIGQLVKLVEELAAHQWRASVQQAASGAAKRHI